MPFISYGQNLVESLDGDLAQVLAVVLKDPVVTPGHVVVEHGGLQPEVVGHGLGVLEDPRDDLALVLAGRLLFEVDDLGSGVVEARDPEGLLALHAQHRLVDRAPLFRQLVQHGLGVVVVVAVLFVQVLSNTSKLYRNVPAILFVRIVLP